MSLISLIIPCFNSSRTIRECLYSVLESSLLPFEIIVVDDKSTDNSLAIIEDFSLISSVPTKIIKKNNNSGPATARNIGARNSNGKYLFFADSDTKLDKDAIAIAFETINNRPQKVSGVVGIYNVNKSQGIFAEFKTSYYLFHMARKGIIDYDAFSASCALIRRDDFFAVGGYDQWFTPGLDLENEELGYRLVENGFKLVLNPAIRCDHDFPAGIILLKIFFVRTACWMEMSMVRRTFTKALSTKNTGFTSLIPFFTIFLGLLIVIVHSSFLIVVLIILLIVYLMLCLPYLRYYMHKNKSPKIFRIIFATYFSHLFISFGAIYGVIKVLVGRSLIFNKFSKK
tara:strand:+ start:1888 stop:2913 length:1026 start_codon:yes stop_codon:yes gene_type:complete